jgi:hypothetical protein
MGFVSCTSFITAGAAFRKPPALKADFAIYISLSTGHAAAKYPA